MEVEDYYTKLHKLLVFYQQEVQVVRQIALKNMELFQREFWPLQ